MCSKPCAATLLMCLHIEWKGGGCSDHYSWCVIFHVNRGWQDIAIPLFVKLAEPHIHTRSAVQISKELRGLERLSDEVCCCERAHTQEIYQSASLYKNLFGCEVIDIYLKRPQMMLHKQLPEWSTHLNSSDVQFCQHMVQAVIHKCWCSLAHSRAIESPEVDITAHCHPCTLITGLGEERWLRPLHTLVRLCEAFRESGNIRQNGDTVFNKVTN